MDTTAFSENLSFRDNDPLDMCVRVLGCEEPFASRG